MKCIKNLVNNQIERVSDQEAADKVKSNKFIYIPKSEWKKSKAVANE